MTLVTNFPSGVNNVGYGSTGGLMPEPDSPICIEYFDDFVGGSDLLIATPGSWTITNADSSTIAAVASGTSAYGGAVKLTVGAATINHFYSFQTKGLPFLLSSTQPWSIKTRMQVHTVPTEVIVGLCAITATPFTAIADGAWISSSVAGVISGNLSVGSVVTSVGMAATFVADTYITLGMRLNPDSSNIEFLVNDKVVSSVASAGLITTAGLAPTFGILNGTGVAVNATFDYFDFKQVR